MSKLGVHPSYQRWLVDELLERKTRNAGYSIRAFARDLGVNKSSLADVLAGKQHLSARSAQKVAEVLEWSPTRTRKMLLELRGLPTPEARQRAPRLEYRSLR